MAEGRDKKKSNLFNNQFFLHHTDTEGSLWGGQMDRTDS